MSGLMISTVIMMTSFCDPIEIFNNLKCFEHILFYFQLEGRLLALPQFIHVFTCRYLPENRHVPFPDIIPWVNINIVLKVAAGPLPDHPLISGLLLLIIKYSKIKYMRMQMLNREGRRASDGLVAQGILHSQSEYPLKSIVAFNSQRLHEACKAKGVLELHLLQKEAAQLKTQYQSNVPPDEMSVRQIQHNQFHIVGGAVCNGGAGGGGTSYSNGNLGGHFQPQSLVVPAPSMNGTATAVDINALYMKQQQDFFASGGGASAKSDLSAFVGLFKNELVKLDAMRGDYKLTEQIQLQQLQQQQAAVAAAAALQKPPLQQQLMQHRLLQQKRQILQKQVAMETGLSRRQMLRQQSYKIAQQQQILPPLPLNESESEDLLAFQAIVEGPAGGGVITGAGGMPGLMTTHGGSPKMMKTSHMQQQQQQLPAKQADCWNTLSGSMQTCQISDSTLSHENWAHPTIYHQVYYNK